MKCDYYCQCNLERSVNNCRETTTTWLPQQFAHINEVLSLKDKSGEWTSGWLVTFAGNPLPARIVEANERNYLKQRKASDIVFSKIKKQNEEFDSCF